MRKAAIWAPTTVLLCLAMLAVGALYNLLSIRHYRAQAGVPGEIYAIAGRGMHIYCTGRGSPTIVLDAGLGDDSLVWARVQPALSAKTRICSYDRAGFGWSEPRSGRRDAVAIAGELHALLAAADETKPVILMGHSIAGLYLRAYAARYPRDLAGLVFVDGATPLQDDRVPAALVGIQDAQRRGLWWTRMRVLFGWYRLTGACTAVMPGFERYAPWIRADTCIPSQIDAIAAELDAERSSGEQTIRAKPPRDLPILILSRDPKVLPSNWPPDVARANAVVWNVMQEEAKSLGTHSRRIIARGSDHYIQIDRPGLVVREVASFIDHVRAGDVSGLDGSTREE